MIKLNNISKKYDSLQVLENFNFTLEDNKITCLLGPSGVGKTTIANITAGLVDADKGSVYGIENALYSYVFQEPRLLNWYTVYENIEFVLKDIYNENNRKKIIDNIISMVELTEFKDYRPTYLSGGMAQRVSLARAFAYPSNVLIMDEPFKGLDIRLKKDMTSVFKKLWNDSKRTVLFITHDIDEALYLSDYICIIKNRPAKLIKEINVDFKSTDEHKKAILNLLR